MPRLNKDDWQFWHKAIRQYRERQTEGLIKDLAALEAHIKELQRVAPKIAENIPHYQAAEYIERLQFQAKQARVWLASVKTQKEATETIANT